MNAPRNLFSWRNWLPTPGNVIFTILIVAIMFTAQSAWAFGAPQTAPASPDALSNVIAYQGRLADAAGNPLTATYPMIFRLYNQNSGGTPLWEEQWTGSNSVKVSDGLFSVMLGSLTAIPTNLAENNNNLWLGITVGTDDEMAPRVQVGSTFAAMFARTVADGSITTAKIANGAVTLSKLGSDVVLIPPDGSITTEKLADNAVNDSKIADGSVGWADLAPNTASKIMMLDQPILILDEWGGATTLRTLDLSAYVPVTAHSVLLELNSGGTNVRMCVYTPGATYASVCAQAQAVDDSNHNQGWVKMVNRTVQLGTSMSPSSMIIWIIGYME